MPHVLSDHMVLQRDAPIHIWGWAQPGEAVSVSLQHAGSAGKGALRANATADRLGQWSVYLPAQPAGGPFDLAVQGSSTVTLHDVMLGDLWIASGQSNMEMPLAGFGPTTPLKDGEKEIAAATHPELRLMVVPKTGSAFPQDDVNAAWTECTPETAKNFSAVAYFFGREIAAREHVTIGLVDTTWGGTPAEAWTSFDAFGKNPALAPVWTQWGHFVTDQTTEALVLAANKREDEQRVAAGQQPVSHGFHPNPDSYRPASLYNGMIAPFTPLSIRGVIWYQGETNSRLDRSIVYHQLFRSMILDWRDHFAQGAFPFLYAQISSFRSTPQEAWGVLRDAQRRTLDVANTAMAVTLDVGTPDNVHPPDKQTVGHRLALAARSLAYGERVAYSGPLFARADVEGNAMRVGFEDRLAKVQCTGGACTGFEIAGADHKFVPAEAVAEGATVIVRSSAVADPRYVRYAWPNAPTANLQDSNGLPASTFTSEQEITDPGPRSTALTHD
ncbi:sialate O-acetylesterase [Terriglobus aquaticus]|uniref:Sialate O-acetylesterase n=1 Tax=Terriglobus aquaticus TaxID=940139 RepID=A0ABW9KN63_9BACT|nr:sialate O-acetylesterase [Terriglobus aquaticus]